MLTHAVDYACGARCGFPSPAGSGAYFRASPCGLRFAVLAVDYVADATVDWWIREKWGLASPPHPSGRTESCTLRILRMLLGAHGRGGDDCQG